MNILIFTKSEWSDENSTGNTFTNLFSNIDEEKIANLYCKNTKPNNNVCVNYYSISDLDIVKSFLPPFKKPGKAFKQRGKKNISENNKTLNTESYLYNIFRGKNSIIPLMLQNIIWSTNRWNNKKLDRYLKDFNPDIIFVPAFQNIYTNRILWELKKRTGAKIVLFLADDYFHDENKKRRFLSKSYYDRRKQAITKSIKLASLHYCISHKQQKEYSKRFNTEMKILYKGGNFEIQPTYEVSDSERINLVYIGSLYYGRWKTLSLLAKKMEKINEYNSVKFFLKIYSQYQPTEEVLKNIERKDISKFYGKIPAESVGNTMKNSDIVLHIESFEEEEKNLTRLSFSTKIVDCLESGRTLFAIGDEEAASIEYLSKDNVALIANNSDEIMNVLREIQQDTSILNSYAQRGWEYGEKHHKITTIRKKLYKDLEDIIKGE